MNWYYVEAGQQAGPVDDTQLAELERSGRLQSDTLVWHEGMTEWRPYHYVKPGATAAPPVAAAAAVPVAGLAEGVCAECNGIFNLQDMIRHGDLYVCAKCKPVFMQKLAEGASLSLGRLTYAGFWIRFGAVFLDGVILSVVNIAIRLAAGLGAFQSNWDPSPGFPVALVLGSLLQMAIAIAYETVMIGKYGATLGKMACKIKVVTPDGGRVSYARALGRYFAKLLSWMICTIGYIIAAFDDEKRALHDRICNTRVVLR